MLLAPVILLLTYLVGLSASSEILLQKCCPEKYAYNMKSDQCEKVEGEKFYDWIPDQLKSSKQSQFIRMLPFLEEFDLKYGPCPEILQDVARPVKIDRNTDIKLSKNSIVVSNQTFQQWCLDAVLGQSSRQWVLLSCPCLHENCITRCCPHGKRLHIERAVKESFGEICEDEGSSWSPEIAEDLEINENTLKPTIFRNLSLEEYLMCFRVVRKNYEKTKHPKLLTDFEIDEFGTLKSYRFTANRWSYCLAEARVEGELMSVAMYCDRADYNRISKKDSLVISFLGAVGAFFTLITLIIHLIVKDLRHDISGQIIIAHCICLFSGYLIMAFRPLAWSQKFNLCTILGTFSYFFFMSSYFWLNVRAIIIYSKFKSLDSMLSKSFRNHTFPLCALYALGSPVLITAFMAWAQFTDDMKLPWWVVWPGIDEASCWFRSPLGRGLYFSLPMGIALLINIFLFIKTVTRIRSFRKDNQLVLNEKGSNRNNLKEIFKLDTKNLKHFGMFLLLLCVTYFPEFIAWFDNEYSFFYFLSIFVLTLRAVLLFVIFCCRRKVWLSARRQYRSLGQLASWTRECFRKEKAKGLNKSTLTDSTNLEVPKHAHANNDMI
ncbi:G-protein coupled receptor Mth-like [Neocloeon triangulifer]|uniref:G-protein coupled receptor Mth-like n=1 Tax=Neocloeon triangulifer TaxID=2078957 RepID=UPI00286EC344|nr:G-protein coupled receptor Mth-like [Neocloeon triangulifer]